MKKREQNKANSINRICTGFFELLQQRELNEISMTDISNQIGMKRSTVYGYFGSVKEISDYLIDLNNKYCENFINEHFDFLRNGEFITELHVKEALTPLIRKIAEQPSHYFLIEKLDFTYLPILDIMRELFNKIVEQNNPQIPYINYFQYSCKYAIYGVILTWIKNGAVDSPEDIVEVITRNLFCKFY